MRKERSGAGKAHFWDIENVAVSYSYNVNLHRDFNLEYDRTKTWKGNVSYNHNGSPFLWEPFKKVKFMKKSNWWGLIRDANLYLGAKNISVSNDVLRTYNDRKVKNNISPGFEFDPVYVKNFTWNRIYGYKYDITKNLKFDFNATNRGIFAEANGAVDRKADDLLYKGFQDSIKRQLATLGKTMAYNHNFTFSYNLPFDKIPLLNFVNSNVKYNGAFEWKRAPLGQAQFGNVIQNSRNINATAQANFTTLYNKVPLLKKVNDDGKGGRNVPPKGGKKVIGDAGKDGAKPAATPADEENKRLKRILKKIAALDKKLLDSTLVSTEKSTLEDKLKSKKDLEKKIRARLKKRGSKMAPLPATLLRMAMAVRNVSGTYALTDGTLLPGYIGETRILGYNSGMGNTMSDFILGKQTRDIYGRTNGFNFADRMSGSDLLVKNSNLNTQYVLMHTQNISGRATLEPLKDLMIDLSWSRQKTDNKSEFYRFNDATSQYEHQSPVTTGTLSYSTITFGTAFMKQNPKTYSSALFDNLRNNRVAVSSLLGSTNTNSTGTTTGGYASGYGGTQQEVLIGAFISSFTDKAATSKVINPFKNVPLPNWNVTYNGLTKFDFMKKYVKNFVIKHGYSSTVNIAGIQSNLNAVSDANGNATALDLNGNFINDRQIQNVVISERFSPLIGFDATWTINGQGLITKFEIKKDRSATLSLNNTQLTEVIGQEYVFGTGYKFDKVKVKLGGKKFESPVNIRADLSIRNNLTVIRRVVENTNQATAGQKVASIKFSADYNLNQNLTIQLYYDQVITKPKVLTSYRTGNINAGLRVRFNLSGIE